MAKNERRQARIRPFSRVSSLLRNLMHQLYGRPIRSWRGLLFGALFFFWKRSQFAPDPSGGEEPLGDRVVLLHQDVLAIGTVLDHRLGDGGAERGRWRRAQVFDRLRDVRAHDPPTVGRLDRAGTRPLAAPPATRLTDADGLPAAFRFPQLWKRAARFAPLGATGTPGPEIARTPQPRKPARSRTPARASPRPRRVASFGGKTGTRGCAR